MEDQWTWKVKHEELQPVYWPIKQIEKERPATRLGKSNRAGDFELPKLDFIVRYISQSTISSRGHYA